MSDAALLPPELLDDVRVKFVRYSTEADGARLLSASGLRYLLKSSPSGPLGAVGDAHAEEYFVAAAGPGGDWLLHQASEIEQ